MGQTRALNVTPFLTTGIYAGLALLLWMPLIISSSTLFPFVVGKAFYARTLIEAIVALWLVLLITTPRYRPPRSWVLLALGIYTGVALLSAVLGVNFTHSFWSDYERMSGVWDLIHWFFLALVAASVLRSARAWRCLLSWNLVVVLVLALLALSQVFGVPKLSYIVYACRVDATLGNSSYLAAILAVMAFVAVGLLARSLLPAVGGTVGPTAGGSQNNSEGEKRWLQAFWLVVGGLALWVLFHTGGRGALIGLAAGAVAMPLGAAIFNRQALRPVALAASGLLLAGAAIFAFDLAVGLPATAGCGSQTASQTSSQTTSARILRTSIGEVGSGAVRLALADIAVEGFLDRPAFGWGQDNTDRVFDRHSKASIYKSGPIFQDQIHNKVLEELATKGALGTVAYLALWGVLVWAVVRRRRLPREDVLAYCILGGLSAYFVQNLFLFDTPATALQWTILVAWVAWQEQTPEVAPLPSGAPRTGGLMRFWPGLPRVPALGIGVAAPARLALVTAIVVAFAMSGYFLNYRPYAASETFLNAKLADLPLAQRLDLAKQSFNTFPVQSSDLKIEMFQRLAQQWNGFGNNDRRLATAFVATEVESALDDDPRNARLIMTALPILQANAFSQGAVDVLEPLVQRLAQLAPERVGTHQALARQAQLNGNFRESIRIAEAFEARAPGTERSFQIIKEDALEHLNAENQSDD